MYKYETHLHTYPVSKCARASVRETLEFYKSRGYDGVFITNHFIDSNINIDRHLPYSDRINFFFSDYEEGVKIGKELGIKVFPGLEITCESAHLLIYGIDKAWLLERDVEKLDKREMLKLMKEAGALIIHAHPFRGIPNLESVPLFPQYAHGVEWYNASRADYENQMAKLYVENTGLIPFAGSDNHRAGKAGRLGGVESDVPVESEADFIRLVCEGKMRVFEEIL